MNDEGQPEEKLETLPEVIEVDVPTLTDIPERVQQILCLMACGFSPSSISKLAKVTPGAIRNTLNKYDPERKFSLSKTERRRFLSKLWEARAGEALLNMTPEKMENASASALARIAATASKQMKEVAPVEQDEGKNPDDILSGMGIIELPQDAAS